VETWDDGLVLDDLEAARRSYDDAIAAVDDAQRALQDARDGVPRARELLHAAIVRAAKAGARQVDIAQVSGYRRERVRQVLRAAGIEPAS
jgi:hypothetical protein